MRLIQDHKENIMANDRSDFEPEIRNSAWWASDTRRAVNGKAVEVILQKQGKTPIPDLSHIEAVQMGHVMQPIILRLAQDALKQEVKDADYMLTHPKEQWLRCHFDGITADGKILVEAKNYNAATRNKYDFETGRIPSADWAQLVHECAVHQLDKICFAVLFGGNEFKYYIYDVTEQHKEELIKEMAGHWGHVIANTLPTPDSIEASKLVFPEGHDGVVTATRQMEYAIEQLKSLNVKAKEINTLIDQIELDVRNAMGENSEIRDMSGHTLVTWRNSKPTKRFSSDLFKSAMPDVYDQFIIDMPGSRRFLIK